MYSGMTFRFFVGSNLIMVYNFNSSRLCRAVLWFSVIFLSVDNCHLKGHLSKLGLVDLVAVDANKHLKQLHMFCDCEALAMLKFRHLGIQFLKLGDFVDIHQEGTALSSKCGAAECLSSGLHKRTVEVQGSLQYLPYCTSSHMYLNQNM
jgi:hypothetical protein